ncbi:protein FAM200A-like [Tachypleus tridentatus]|uniref:protein FAM200A-like n=1 Tax=Tachypleus tridentatus TaxID=6853 RepID=UPI003FD464FE
METNSRIANKDIGSYKLFFICLGESTGVTSSAKLAIIARLCRGDEICEELVNLVTLPKHTTGVEICKALVNKLSSRQVDLSKIFSVTTDGALSMTGKEAGFVNLFAKYVRHPLLGFRCIIHKEVLHAKTGLKELKKVMEIVTKVVNFTSMPAYKKKTISEFIERGEFAVHRTTYVRQCPLAK